MRTAVLTLVATPDPENCPTCAAGGRVEKLNATDRHQVWFGYPCVRLFWCYVCSEGYSIPIDCEEHQ